MLNDLVAQEGTSALQRRLQRYCAPRALAIDEVGYLSYDHRHADLLFEVVTRRYGVRSTLITTNQTLCRVERGLLPNAACVVTLIDRLVHHAEIVQIEGGSYRLKEAKGKCRKESQRSAPHGAASDRDLHHLADERLRRGGPAPVLASLPDTPDRQCVLPTAASPPNSIDEECRSTSSAPPSSSPHRPQALLDQRALARHPLTQLLSADP